MSGIPTLIIIAAVMFCILGGISVVAHLYNLNSIKSKTVGDGQHGRLGGQLNRKYEKPIGIFRLHQINGANKPPMEKLRLHPELSNAGFSKARKKNSRKKLCRRALWLVAQAANTIQQHLWIQEMSMC